MDFSPSAEVGTFPQLFSSEVGTFRRRKVIKNENASFLSFRRYFEGTIIISRDQTHSGF